MSPPRAPEGGQVHAALLAPGVTKPTLPLPLHEGAKLKLPLQKDHAPAFRPAPEHGQPYPTAAFLLAFCITRTGP